MAITPAAITELRHALAAFRAAHSVLAVPTGSGRALEAWVLMKLASAADRMWGWTVTLRQGDGSPLPPGGAFLFAAGGSGIRPASVSAPGFALLVHDDHGAFELHGSLEWRGRSGATHECDIALLPAPVAHPLRLAGGGHPHGLPIAIIECKDRTSDGSLDEMREVVARMFDLALVTRPAVGAVRLFDPITLSVWGRYSSQYRALFRRGLFAVVRSRGFQAGAHTLGMHYHVGRFPRAYARGIGGLEVRIRTLLANIGTL